MTTITRKELIKSIYDTPENWKLTEHLLKNTVLDVGLWTVGGFSEFGVATEEGRALADFSFWEKYRAWRAFKWWQQNVPITIKIKQPTKIAAVKSF